MLPTVAQTPHLLTRQIYTDGGSTGEVFISTGDGWATSSPVSNAQQFTSLAGIAYPRNS